MRRILPAVMAASLLLMASFAASAASSAATTSGATGPIPTPTGSCYHDPYPPYLAPNQSAQLYGLAPLWAKGFKGSGKSIAILDPYEKPDVQEYAAFTKCMGITTPLDDEVFGPGNPPAVGGEATLDAIIAVTAAPELDHIYMFSGTDALENNQLALLQRALDPANTGGTRVDAISTSFSFCEQDLQAGKPHFTNDYMQQMNAALQQAAAAGVTVFADAGDGGSADCAGWPQEESNPRADHAAVGFPTSSPWVVSVGGTQLDVTHNPDGTGSVNDEIVWNEPSPSQANARMGGGGGHSIVFGREPWQTGFAPTAARSVPDIAMMAGSPYWGGGGNGLGYWDGTSAATPYSAAGWLVVISALEAQGLSSPGFLAPVLYDLARNHDVGAPRDITIGNNDLWGKVGCCGATTGYDEASGLGSLQFDALADALGPARASLVATPPSGDLPLTVTLDASGSTTPGGTITSCTWDDNGDGSPDATTTTPTHVVTYQAARQYTPSVSITTSVGRTATASTTVTAGPVPSPTSTSVPSPSSPPVAVVAQPRFAG